MWETDKKQTVTYKRPETTWQLLEKWKPKPVVLNFEELFSQTMLIESMDIVYKDGQGNIHITMTLVEHKPVKIVTYSNTKQLLKPGVIITKASKADRTQQPNQTKRIKRSQVKKRKPKRRKSKAAKENADNAKGAFDYTAQRNKISSALAKPM